MGVLKYRVFKITIWELSLFQVRIGIVGLMELTIVELDARQIHSDK